MDMQKLTAMEATDEEKTKTITVARRNMESARRRAPKIALRTVRKAGFMLNSGADPGPSGTTNKILTDIHECRDGPNQLKRLAELWVGGLVRPRDAARWTATVLAPINQGWKEAEGKYKIRPVGLMECLLEHIESIIAQHRLRQIREKLEPQALSLAPEGILATVKILRSWANKADLEEPEAMYTDSEDDDDYVARPCCEDDDTADEAEGNKTKRDKKTVGKEERTPEARASRRKRRQITSHTVELREARRGKQTGAITH